MAAALIVDLILCNVILKNLIARTRPYDINTAVQIIIAKPYDYSFPSGHTAASFASVAALYLAGAKKGWKIATALGLTAIVAVGAVVFCVKSGENMEHPFVELYGDSYEILTKEKLGHTITITDNGLDW